MHKDKSLSLEERAKASIDGVPCACNGHLLNDILVEGLALQFC